MRYAVLVLWLAFVVLVGVGGCSSPATGSTGPSTNVSFTNDLMPLFQSSCSTAQAFTCHGDPVVETTTVNGQPNQPRPYFGPYMGTATADVVAEVYGELVGKASNEAPSIDYVTPGNLDQSFLWRKVDNELTSIQAQCTTMMDPPCGLPMPNDSVPLTQSQLDLISGWIQGGAPQN